MTTRYLDYSKSTDNLTHRLSVLTKLVNLAPGTEFFASDLGLTGNDMNALRMDDIVRAVPKGREEFICVDEDENLYKKVYVHCWTVPNVHELREGFKQYCALMIGMFSVQMMMLEEKEA